MGAADLLEAVRDVVRGDLVEPLAEAETLWLYERDLGAGGARTKVRVHADDPLLALRLDRCAERPGGLTVDDRIFPLLREEGGLRRSCDYVVLCAHKNVFHVVLFELKATKAKGAFDQIANTRVLIDGLLRGAELHRAPDPADRVVYRGVILTGTAKQPKGQSCPYDLRHPRMDTLSAAILPADRDYTLRYFCP